MTELVNESKSDGFQWNTAAPLLRALRGLCDLWPLGFCVFRQEHQKNTFRRATTATNWDEQFPCLAEKEKISGRKAKAKGHEVVGDLNAKALESAQPKATVHFIFLYSAIEILDVVKKTEHWSEKSESRRSSVPKCTLGNVDKTDKMWGVLKVLKVNSPQIYCKIKS